MNLAWKRFLLFTDEMRHLQDRGQSSVWVTRIRERIAEEIVDIPGSQILEAILEVMVPTPQERVQTCTVERRRKCSRRASRSANR